MNPSPSQHCAALASQLADMARQELTPRLHPLLPDDRKAAVRTYWLAQMADLGIIGQAVAGAVAKGAA